MFKGCRYCKEIISLILKKISPVMQIAIFYHNSSSTLSYNDDWIDAFTKFYDSSLKIKAYDITRIDFREWLNLVRTYDLLIFLHSTNSNATALNRMHIYSLLFRKGKTVFFIGNEYKLIPEKIMLLKKTKADYVVSQLPQNIAEWLYSGICKNIISVPHALNIEVFQPVNKFHDRKIDVGSRSAEYPWYLGDTDRNKAIDFMRSLEKNGFAVNVSSDMSKRFERADWANFLNNCKFTVATEAGTSFLEKDDKTRKAVNKFVNGNTDKTFEDVFEVFFKNYKNPVSGKCISPRHFDAIGTKTCQILLEGRYNDILKPNEHYIELKKDYSNLEEVMEKMRDYPLVKQMIDKTYEYVLGNHTHRHRIQYLFSKII